MPKKKEIKQFDAEILADLGLFHLSDGKTGPAVIKAQVIQYSKNSEPGLNLQRFYVGRHGDARFGKRPLLVLRVLKWIHENNIVEQAIEELEKRED